MLLRSVVAPVYQDKDYKGCRPLTSLSSLTLLSPAPLFVPHFSNETRDTAVGTFMADMRKVGLKSSSKPPASSSSSSASLPSSNSLSLSQAFHNVCRLPRKASRLVCIADPARRMANHSAGSASAINHSEERRVVGKGDDSCGEKGKEEEEERERLGLIQYSDTCSATGSESSRFSETGSRSVSSAPSGHVSSYTSTSSSSRSSTRGKSWIPKHIISPDQIEQALASDSSSSPSSSRRKAGRHLQSHMEPGLSKRGGVTQQEASVIPSAFPITSEIGAIDEESPVARPLSPPPDHFRRRERVLSATGAPGPYTTPVNSPPTSPQRPGYGLSDQSSPYGDDEYRGRDIDRGQEGRKLRLHDLLSSESLAAPPLKLYNGAGDSDSESESGSMFDSRFASRLKTRLPSQNIRKQGSTRDVDSNVHVPASTSSVAARRDAVDGKGVRSGAAKSSNFLQSGSRSSFRSRSRGPVKRESDNCNDSHALRRVFSN